VGEGGVMAFKKLPVALRALLLFLPEIVVCLLILIQPILLEASFISVANKVFEACSQCLASRQFLLSTALLTICLSIHLIRFLIFQVGGSFLLRNHNPSGQEMLISLLIVATYCVFLVKSLNPTVLSDGVGVLGVFDVVGASVAALALIVMSKSVFSLFIKKEK
jgi:hypothetical protein